MLDYPIARARKNSVARWVMVPSTELVQKNSNRKL